MPVVMMTSNNLISNGSEALIIDGSDSGSMFDLFDDHQDNISQFPKETVKCGNQGNLDTVKCVYIYLYFQRKPLMNLYIFATVHSLLNDIKLIDSCKAHLPLQHAKNIELIHQK